jgi:endonuclease/exonuclease/phosphatase family metal-dependent hydrolase
MKLRFLRFGSFAIAALVLSVLTAVATAQTTQNVRIASYNIEDDINGATVPLPGLPQVLEGIGEENVLGNVQPLDILALQETTSNASLNSPTGQASGKGLIDTLNAFYGASASYAVSSYQATESGGDTADGNGPNTVIYNTKTLNLLASVPVDPTGGTSKLGSSSGEYREVMRYEFQPKNDTNSGDAFYVYVSHYKSGTGTTNENDRTGEAQIIVNNEATLPAGSAVLLVGDYNVSSSSETSYQDVVASNSLANLPAGKGVDPLNLTASTGITWGSSTVGLLSESATDLRYRDDFQVMSQHVYRADAGGLEYINGTYHVFGNNGTTAYKGSVNSRANTSLNSLMLRGDMNGDGSVTAADITQMLSALTNLSGYQSAHSLSNSALLAVADVNRDGVVNNADLQALLGELQNPTAANAPVNISTVLSDLTTASDHLPIVADYSITYGGGSLSAVPEPSALVLAGIGGLLICWRRRRVLSLQIKPAPAKT